MKVFTIMGAVFIVIGAFFGYQALQPARSALGGGDAAPILAITFLPIGIIFTLIGLFVTRLSANRYEARELYLTRL